MIESIVLLAYAPSRRYEFLGAIPDKGGKRFFVLRDVSVSHREACFSADPHTKILNEETLKPGMIVTVREYHGEVAFDIEKQVHETLFTPAV